MSNPVWRSQQGKNGKIRGNGERRGERQTEKRATRMDEWEEKTTPTIGQIAASQTEATA